MGEDVIQISYSSSTASVRLSGTSSSSFELIKESNLTIRAKMDVSARRYELVLVDDALATPKFTPTAYVIVLVQATGRFPSIVIS